MDIIQFLEEHNIPYVTSGLNVGRGEIAIRCPFCEDDPSEHMGWDLQTGYWNCLRASGHSGRRPHRLIIQLLGCTYEQAEDIVSGGRDLASFQDQISRLLGDKPTVSKKPRTLEMPKEFRSLTSKGSGRYFVDYLVNRRGFRQRDIPALAGEYDLRFSTNGHWQNRVIFPLRFEGRLVCWTGRSISNREGLRYLSLGSGEGDTEYSALLTPKELVYNFDALLEQSAKALFVTEGPIDAVKVDLYGKKLGARATCLFGTGITEDQAIQLAELRPSYKRLFILGDEGAQTNVWLLMNRLAHLQPRLAKLPYGVADPGELSYNEVRTLVREHV